MKDLNNITTPICDFVENYIKSDFSRLHMPGHKGRELLGFEHRDITEIKGADSLYEAEGIIAESEKNASALFGSAGTFFSTEGSSQCIRAMLYIAVKNRKKGTRPVVAAARNVHKAFVYAAALLDFEIIWLWGENDGSLLKCNVTERELEEVLKNNSVSAVYITSPNYLGGNADIKAIAEVCHKNDTLLLVDNAHGAYLAFLEENIHPLNLGADMCCDSAHKTLPALTGCAYLHISENAPEKFLSDAKKALEMFGSTSPSYLLLQSLDMCNKYIFEGYKQALSKTVKKIESVKEELSSKGWRIEKSDPLKITVLMPKGASGTDFAQRLRDKKIECEYADRSYVVLMATEKNSDRDFERLVEAFGENGADYESEKQIEITRLTSVMSVREALFSESEEVSVKDACGRICAAPTVSCPPAIPIAVPGEKITKEAVEVFKFYGFEKIDVVK